MLNYFLIVVFLEMEEDNLVLKEDSVRPLIHFDPITDYVDRTDIDNGSGPGVVNDIERSAGNLVSNFL